MKDAYLYYYCTWCNCYLCVETLYIPLPTIFTSRYSARLTVFKYVTHIISLQHQPKPDLRVYNYTLLFLLSWYFYLDISDVTPLFELVFTLVLPVFLQVFVTVNTLQLGYYRSALNREILIRHLFFTNTNLHKYTAKPLILQDSHQTAWKHGLSERSMSAHNYFVPSASALE